MYCFHIIWEFQSDCVSTRMCNDFKRTQKLLGEFLGRAHCSKELCFDKCEVSNLEVWCWKSFGVSRGLVCLLSIENSSVKFLMQFVQVHNKILSSIRSKVTFRMDGEVWVVAFIGKERRDSSHSTGSIIVGKFSEGKERCLVVLLIFAVDT